MADSSLKLPHSSGLALRIHGGGNLATPLHDPSVGIKGTLFRVFKAARVRMLTTRTSRKNCGREIEKAESYH
jgi:hypothetical protein